MLKSNYFRGQTFNSKTVEMLNDLEVLIQENQMQVMNEITGMLKLVNSQGMTESNQKLFTILLELHDEASLLEKEQLK